MEENNIENLVRTAPFIDKTLKEECSDYLKKQVPKGLDHQIYSLKVFESPYQGELGSVPVEELEAGRYRMMIPVEISTIGGLLLDRMDGLHGYSLEDYPNARFFKGW